MDECILNPTLKTESGVLYERYKTWADKNGVYQITSNKFGRIMTERGFQKLKSNGRYYGGIGLRPEGSFHRGEDDDN